MKQKRNPYPRDPGRWAAEKGVIRLRAYALAHENGPKMATMFHIRKASCDLAICGMIATAEDVDHKAPAGAWTDLTGQLHVVCCDCFGSRETMEAETLRFPSGRTVKYTEDEISESMEFWGEWPEMKTVSDELDAEALKEGLEASGLPVMVIDENTDFSKLPSLGELLGKEKKE